MTRSHAIVIAARRTAIGRAGGMHKNLSLAELAAPVLQAVLSDARIEAGCVGEVIIGNAAGGGGNPARLIALAAGLPDTVPALSIDRQCASGLDAIVAGARLIECGAADAVVAGGAESPSTAPWRVEKPPSLYRGMPRFYEQAAFAPSGMHDPGMVEAAETVARELGISRERQDAYTLESHRRVAAAQTSAALTNEIVGVPHFPGNAQDEGPKSSLSAKLLARMPPLLPNGTVTAGNSCQINDGAAMAVLVSDSLHRGLGSPPGLRLIASASGAVPPRILGMAAVPAFRSACAQAGLQTRDIAAVEFNEAFAAQVLASLDALSLDAKAVNTEGGALAFGHPYGASGAILVARLFSRLLRNPTNSAGRHGAAMIAAAGGVGVTAIFRTTQ